MDSYRQTSTGSGRGGAVSPSFWTTTTVPILKALNNGEEVDVIYLDYAKAFDKVDHEILLAKLRKYGIRGKVLKWINSFLFGREQCVVVEGKHSTFRLVIISGVPQGTVLGPILFILYIDDQIEAVLTSLAKEFADDTKLAKSILSEHHKNEMQADLFRIMDWALVNNMVLNESKFELLNYSLNELRNNLLFHLPFTDGLRSYSLNNGSTIDPSDIVRDLGVLLSNDCSWSPISVKCSRPHELWQDGF